MSFEDPSISVDESDGTYMVCVVKDRDTVIPVQVDIMDLSRGSALRTIGESIDTIPVVELKQTKTCTNCTKA